MPTRVSCLGSLQPGPQSPASPPAPKSRARQRRQEGPEAKDGGEGVMGPRGPWDHPQGLPSSFLPSPLRVVASAAQGSLCKHTPTSAAGRALVPAPRPPRLCPRPSGSAQPRARRGFGFQKHSPALMIQQRQAGLCPPEPPAPHGSRCRQPWAPRAAHPGSCRSVGRPLPAQPRGPGARPAWLGWR